VIIKEKVTKNIMIDKIVNKEAEVDIIRRNIKIKIVK